jgi:2,4-dienoyl-CoA reductase-like NADH-dependent reductase (Old Yellow Enzyme family)
MEALAESPTNAIFNKIKENAKTISSPLTLPCGAILPNRLAKSAMSELLADSHQQATVAHQTLYRTFARNGPGLLVTGNVQVDRLHLEHAGNVVIHGPQDAAHMTSLRACSRSSY